MEHDFIITTFFLIFTGAAIFATLALFTRQSLLVAYIVLGMLLGPYGLKWIDNPDFVTQASDVGIIFLLFLLGLNLHPQNLVHMFRKTFVITVLSSVIFAFVGMLISRYVGFSLLECLIVGMTMTFSSTIIGLKLLPTTVLHHQRMGELIISILLLQDLVAIIMMLLIGTEQTVNFYHILWLLIALPALIVISFLVENYVLLKLLSRFDKIKEYIFLMAIGWCLGVAQIAYWLGLSYEIGAFIAGVSIAVGPIALFIAESLKPLRDFFLVMFFFSLGANFNITSMPNIFIPALVLAAAMLVLKPFVFNFLLRNNSENGARSWEIGVRLGQVSEFSLLVGFMAYKNQFLSLDAYQLIELATIITFIASSYAVVLYYPTPIALDDKLRRD